MTFAEGTKYLRIRTTLAQRRAAIFLEHRGQRFWVDFGYENCINKAKYERRMEADKARGVKR